MDVAKKFHTELPENEPVIIMTRTFDAPRDLVWTVWTQPEHVAVWWGPYPDNKVTAYDVRTGGKWRVESSMPDGSVIVFFGTYLNVQPELLIRNTFVVEGMFEEDERFHETHTFEESDGRTLYKSVSLVDSFEARQAIVDSGMEWGANESMIKFDAILRQLAGK
jgi:uncharacterized protein YndB with AHSA1/START domain